MTVELIEINENTEQGKEKLAARSSLLLYCHSAEVLVYAFGLFGASVFLEEARVIASMFYSNIPPILHKFTAYAYGFLLVLGVGLNRYYLKEWFNSRENKYKYMRYYSFTRASSLGFGAIWVAFLVYASCPNLKAVVALVILTLYYLSWVFLRFCFAPMTHTKTLTIE